MASVRSDRNKKPYSRPRRSEGFWLHDRASNKPSNTADTSKSAAPNTKLVVSNLHYEITPNNLVSIFGQVGTLVREPLIRYDRSGRSSGVAIVTFETAEEAERAKKQFEGKIAKGQPMEIAFDTAPPKRLRSTSLPGVSTSSLLNRIERPSLAERLDNGSEPTRKTSTTGPIRRHAARPLRGAPGSRGGRVSRPRPKTAEELDRELDVFMGEDGQDGTNADSAAVESTAGVVQDVEMA
ncbi:hypothetical protein EDD17DRAFT_1466083 [Pisolithus thermaeus]|nr:hypothetical protein EDD17DRAFT_1466083 [Pisolithus thermaeus]